MCTEARLPSFPKVKRSGEYKSISCLFSGLHQSICQLFPPPHTISVSSLAHARTIGIIFRHYCFPSSPFSFNQPVLHSPHRRFNQQHRGEMGFSWGGLADASPAGIAYSVQESLGTPSGIKVVSQMQQCGPVQRSQQPQRDSWASFQHWLKQ